MASVDAIGAPSSTDGAAASVSVVSSVSSTAVSSTTASSVFFVFFFSAMVYALPALSRSWRTVKMRAISRFADRSRALFSSAPVADWKRRLKSSCRRSPSVRASSSSVMSRSVLAFKEISLSLHDLGLHGQLLARELQRFLGQRLRDARQLEHDAARLHDGDPVLRGALARAHARLGRLLRDRLVGEDVDPDLAATLDLARHRDSGSLDLAVGDPPGLERLDAPIAELHVRLPARNPGAASAMDAAVLRLLGEQHLVLAPLIVGLRLRRRGVRSVRDRGRRRLDLRLDHGLLAPLGRHGVLIRPRLLDVLLAPRAAPAAGTRPAAAGATSGTALAAAALAARPARLLDEPETLAILRAAAAGLARGAETLGGTAAPAASLILVAEPRVLAGGHALEALRHDLALVDPDLDADPAVRRLRLGEAVVDVGADRVQRDPALGVAL